MIHGYAKNTKYKILTDTGYQDFSGIAYMGDKKIFRVEFGNKTYLECTDDHKIFNKNFEKIEVQNLKVGDWVLCKFNKKTKVKSIKFTGKTSPVYDLINVEGHHRYFTNNVLSSNCEFLSDEETLIDSMCLARLTNHAKEPSYYIGTTRYYAELKANAGYLVTLDPCTGTGGDFAAIQVFQIPDMIQIAEWSHNKTNTRNQIRMLIQILSYIDETLKDMEDQMGDPEIYWTVENNGVGQAAIQVIEQTGEDRFPGIFVSDRRRSSSSRISKGMFTSRTKAVECARLKSLVESNRMTINSKNLVRQLKYFVATENSFKAKPPEHDDLVSATLLIVKLLDVVIKWEDRNTDRLREHIEDTEIMQVDPMPVVV